LSCLWGAVANRLPAVALTLLLGGLNGACSYKLDSMFARKDEKAEKTEHTGSFSPKPALIADTLEPSADVDLAFARQAAADILSRGGKDTSAPWENPRTGARGTVTPLAAAYTQDGFVCRDFLASYVRQGSEAWLQGEACRQHQGKWEVRSLKPWKRTG